MDIKKALEEVGMYTGRVLTPALARSFAGQRKADAPTLDGFGLVGWMSAKMHKQIEVRPDNIGLRITAFETRLKQMLLVVTVQAGACQMRFLAHLADPNVKEMLKWSAKNGYLQLLLGVVGQTHVIHYHPPFYREDLEPLLALGTESLRVPEVHSLVEFAGSAAELIRKKDKLVCSGMGAVNDVTVTTIPWHYGMAKTREASSGTLH